MMIPTCLLLLALLPSSNAPAASPASSPVAVSAGSTVWATNPGLASAQPVQETKRRSQGRKSKSGRDGRNQGMIDADKASPFEINQWFDICDVDKNDWISFHESKDALRFSKSVFLSFDNDKDGRMRRKEFSDYYQYAFKRSEFVPPRRRAKTRPPGRTAQQLLLAYDADLNGGISLPEVRRILGDYSRESLDTHSIFARIDQDRSKLLDLGELMTLNSAIKALNSAPVAEVLEAPKGALDDFFGKVLPSPSRNAPDRITGPVTTYRRLDADGDGNITAKDLSELQRSAVTKIRPQTVLHTLDSNQDGILDRAEFLRAMERPRE